MKLSVELVPRSEAHLEQELQAIAGEFPGIEAVNVPDLLRFDTRSWQACRLVKRYLPRAIAHLRAIDIDLNKPLPIRDYFLEHGLDEVLVIAGDAPADMGQVVYDSSTLEVIRKIRSELPEVRVFAGLDPYRQSFVAELAYAEQKLEAGASGFFSQPFFDLRLMDVYAELLSGVDIYWGVTTVTSPRSLSYWRNRNKAVFPCTFEPTMDWSRNFARQALRFAERRDTNLYFMPIRSKTRTFLEGLLS